MSNFLKGLRVIGTSKILTGSSTVPISPRFTPQAYRVMQLMLSSYDTTLAKDSEMLHRAAQLYGVASSGKKNTHAQRADDDQRNLFAKTVTNHRTCTVANENQTMDCVKVAVQTQGLARIVRATHSSTIHHD
jgi:hypothetical protein